jgi:hypothetical protein
LPRIREKWKPDLLTPGFSRPCVWRIDGDAKDLQAGVSKPALTLQVHDLLDARLSTRPHAEIEENILVAEVTQGHATAIPRLQRQGGSLVTFPECRPFILRLWSPSMITSNDDDQQDDTQQNYGK